MRFKIAQKLLRALAAATGSPTLPAIRQAGVPVFEARAREADELGRLTRPWPPIVTAYSHWGDDSDRAAASGGIALPLHAAVAAVNTLAAP